MSDVPDDLSEGWVLARLGELVVVLDSKRVPINADERAGRVGPYPYYGANGQVGTIDDYLFDGDFILVAEDGGFFDQRGRGVAYRANGKIWVNNHAHILQARSGVELLFLLNYFNSIDWMPFVSGTTRLKLTQGKMVEVPVLLAPLREQRRIVAKIEALQARSRKAREALEAIPPLLEQFRQSVLAAAFRGDLTADWREQNPDVEPAGVLLERIRAERRRKWEQAELAKFKSKGKVPKDDSWKEMYVEPEPVDEADLPELPEGWCWAALDELVNVQLGQRRAPEFAKLKQYPYIRSANITWQGLDLSDVKTMGFADPDSLQMESGDVLLNEASGSPTEVGKPALWRCEIPHCCFQATVLRLRSRSPDVREEWLYYHCLKDALLGEYAARTPGIGIIHLTAKLLRTWPIPLAPIKEQCAIIAKLETAIKVARNLEISAQQSSSEVSQLDQSILAKAFRGELVPQDPNDEPASVLLERIQTERDDVVNDKPARGRRKQTN